MTLLAPKSWSFLWTKNICFILKIIQQQNELLAAEISDLTKIIKLNVEESKLKKEIKESETKIYKTLLNQNSNNNNTNLQVNNDVSETRNDILQELNNILKEENTSAGENNKGKSPNVNTKVVSIGRSRIIEEEHQEDGSNSMLEGRTNNEAQEHDNKNLKCKKINKI